jgi:co-chaperonin GroES (HSP10)
MSLEIAKRHFEMQDPSKSRPHGDRLLLEEIEVENWHFFAGEDGEQRAIELPQNAKNDEFERGWKLAKIIAMGNGDRMEIDYRYPMEDHFKVGDVVYVERLTGRQIKLRGKNYWIVNQTDILMVQPDLADLMRLPALDANA